MKLGKRFCEARRGSLLEPEKERSRGERENEGRDEHRPCDALIEREPEGFPLRHNQERRAERHESAAIAESPAPARHLAERRLGRDLGQKGRIECFAHVVGKIRENDHEGGPNDRPLSACLTL